LTGYALRATEWGTDIGESANAFELDGLVDGVEYALGGYPVSNDASSMLPPWSMGIGGTKWPYYACNRRDDAVPRGPAYAVLAGNGLVKGLHHAMPARGVSPSSNGLRTAIPHLDLGDAGSAHGVGA
jgi:hypothetical protein